MAFDNNVGEDISYFKASTDLSSNQYCFVVVNSSSQLALAGANVECLGVLQDKPKSGVAGQVRTFGVSKVQCGGSFNPGDKVASNGSGLAVKYTASSVSAGTPEPLAGSLVQGIALTAGVNGQVASILITHSGLSN